MAIPWFVILIIWGILAGFNTIPVVAWLLLVPFAMQDVYDASKNRWR